MGWLTQAVRSTDNSTDYCSELLLKSVWTPLNFYQTTLQTSCWLLEYFTTLSFYILTKGLFEKIKPHSMTPGNILTWSTVHRDRIHRIVNLEPDQSVWDEEVERAGEGGHQRSGPGGVLVAAASDGDHAWRGTRVDGFLTIHTHYMWIHVRMCISHVLLYIRATYSLSSS